MDLYWGRGLRLQLGLPSIVEVVCSALAVRYLIVVTHSFVGTKMVDVMVDSREGSVSECVSMLCGGSVCGLVLSVCLSVGPPPLLCSPSVLLRLVPVSWFLASACVLCLSPFGCSFRFSSFPLWFRFGFVSLFLFRFCSVCPPLFCPVLS